MAPASLRQADLPGIRPIYADLLGDFKGVGGFYPHPPSLEAAAGAASGISLDAGHRRALVDELARQNRDGGRAAQDSLDRLAAEGTVVAVAGQQVGLLGGPVFTLYKALTAVRCAEELSRRGQPAVPVFWLATEDHDLAEVDHCWAFGAEGAPQRIEAASECLPGAAVDTARIKDAGLGRIEELCAGMPHQAEALALAREAYGGTPRFGEAFRALYGQLLAGTGLLFLCPMQSGIRALAAPLVRSAIERGPDLTDALLQRGTGLQAAGYHEQVHVGSSSSLVMLFEERERVALKRKNGAYWARSRRYTREDLLRRLESDPLDLSPSALLRPVMQDFVLPTAALIAGPSEAAYLGQASVLYDDLLGRMPAVLPRASFTVVDGGLRKFLDKYGLSARDCLVPRRELEATVAAAVVPPSVHEALASSQSDIDSALQRTEEALEPFDPTLAAGFRVSRAKIAYQIDKTRNKVSRESLRRSDAALRHAARLSDWLYPNDDLQERVYGVVPFLARYGLGFVDRVREAVEPGGADHKFLEF